MNQLEELYEIADSLRETLTQLETIGGETAALMGRRLTQALAYAPVRPVLTPQAPSSGGGHTAIRDPAYDANMAALIAENARLRENAGR